VEGGGLNLKTVVYPVLSDNKETLHQRNFDAFQTICNCPETFEMIQQFRVQYAHNSNLESNMPIRVSIQRDDILDICCELWLDKQ